MLFGFETTGGELVITEATRSGRNARHGWFSFEPDYEWDKKISAEIYETSGRVTRYLGEWHSHPLGHLHPGRDDTKTMQLIAAYEPAYISNPVSAIVGRIPGQPIKWAIYVLNAAGDLEKARVLTISSPHLRGQPEHGHIW